MARTVEKKDDTPVLVRRDVARALREVFSDPDFGLSLNRAFVRKLRASAEGGHTRALKAFLRE